MPRLLPLRAGLINPLCRAVAGGTFPQAGCRVNKWEGSTKYERELERKAKSGRVTKKAEQASGMEGELPLLFSCHLWHPHVGQWDLLKLLLGKGSGCLSASGNTIPKEYAEKGPEALGTAAEPEPACLYPLLCFPASGLESSTAGPPSMSA